MSSIRRDFLKIAAGGAVGIAASPLPWRLIGDSALWSQNWASIPKLAHGEISFKPTTCALCAGGCAVKARCVGAQPVSLWGQREPLCAAGLVGHHLAFHPARLRKALHGSIDDATNAARKAVDAKARIAVLDLRPGRTASLLYRKAAAQLNAQYLRLAPSYGATLGEVQAWSDATPAYDLEHASLVLSVGTPLMEAWGAPGRVLSAQRKFRVWHADALSSGTAMAAERWFNIQPGTETAFLAGLIAALDNDTPTLAQCAKLTGLREDELRAAAAEMQRERAVVVADAHPVAGAPARETLRAAALLNARLKAYGREGGIVARRETPMPKSWAQLAVEHDFASVADASIDLLYIDDSAPGGVLPWKLIQRKLAPNATVIAATWTRRGLAERATYALPARSYLETIDDAPMSPDLTRARFALSLPLYPAKDNAIEAVEWFAQLAGESVTLADALKQRAAAIHAAHRGELIATNGERTPIAAVKSADEMWTALNAGAHWMDDAAPTALQLKTMPDTRIALAPREAGMRVVPTAWLGAEVSPLMAKLWSESDLKPRTQQVYVHPETARELDIADGGKARLEASCGSCRVAVTHTEAVPRGVLAMAATQSWDALCEYDDGGWRAVAQKVVRL